MMYFLFFLFFPLTSYAYTISVFTDTNQSIAFGQINEELATNFDSNYIEQTIFWKNSNGDILSNAPYLFWIDSNLEPVSFCLLANGNDYCSDFIDLKSTGGEAMSRSDNNYPLSISFLNLENLSIGIQPISKVTLNAGRPHELLNII